MKRSLKKFFLSPQKKTPKLLKIRKQTYTKIRKMLNSMGSSLPTKTFKNTISYSLVFSYN